MPTITKHSWPRLPSWPRIVALDSNALRHERPEDYYENTATIEWPLGADGEAFPIEGLFFAAVVFKDGSNVETAKEFVRFLVAEGWIAHYLDFAGERFLPPMPKLREGPLWLDPSDPHRMASVMQIASRPTQYEYVRVTGNWRYDLVWQEQELTWAKAIHRIVTENISPEQAVDEAIARVNRSWRSEQSCTGSSRLSLLPLWFGPRSARRPPTSWWWQRRLRAGGRGAEGDHRRLRAGERQAG